MSRSERRRFEIGETKEEVFERDEWTCQVCGKPVTPNTAQLAHLIPQSKAMISKYGEKIIHHPSNMLTTCSLACNNRVQVNWDQLQSLIATKIRNEIDDEKEPVYV